MPDPNPNTKSPKKIGIVTKILTQALKLWLRAQVSLVSELEVQIRASDRQIFSGCIPWVSIAASHAVYQGLHVRQVELVAENIQVNIGSVLKGQPLRLLETVPVIGQLIIEEKDLNDSLSSELLSTALNEVLVQVLPEHCPKTKLITWQKIILDNNQMILFGLAITESESTPLEITVGLELLSGHELQLSLLRIQYNMVAEIEGNHKYNLDLGSEVDIQELTLMPDKLVCRGRINVNP
ncbi:MAG: DUF2993 domain-containing protein [Gloeotrichia echinulata IR180]|jgi:hypothetical protein|nr:DUF2993 domain-containing protein [Gloeotrichia echinulata DEX184]